MMNSITSSFRGIRNHLLSPPPKPPRGILKKDAEHMIETPRKDAMSAPVKPPRGVPRSDYKSPSRHIFTPLLTISPNENIVVLTPANSEKGCLPRIMSSSRSRTRTPLGSNNGGDINFTSPFTEPKYSSTEKWNRILDNFRRTIIERYLDEFSGAEATTIMHEYLVQNKDDFKNANIARENAVKVLDQFVKQRVIQSTDGNQIFIDSRRIMYRLLSEDEHSLIPMCRMSTPSKSTNPSITGSSSRRKNSFKSFLRRSFNKVSRDISISRSASVDDSKSIYTTNEEPLTQVDFDIYRAALFRLLTIIEVPHLDDVANLKNQTSDHSDIPILSVILSKMGFWNHERKHDLFAEDMTDEALASNRIASKELLVFFNMCRIIAPQIALKCEFTDCQVQCSAWAAECIGEVVNQLRHLTHDGSAPLFPVEFTLIIEAIIQQILMNDQRWKDERRSLQYLVLMVPPALRKQLQNVVQLIHSARGTRIFCNMGEPPSEDKRDPHVDENFEVIVQNVCNYVMPSSIGYKGQRMLIKGLVSLFEDQLLGSIPLEIEQDIELAKYNCGHVDSPVALNIRFCEERPPIEEDFTTRALVEMIQNDIINSQKLRMEDKRARLKEVRQAHPFIYDKYFAGWLETH